MGTTRLVNLIYWIVLLVCAALTAAVFYKLNERETVTSKPAALPSAAIFANTVDSAESKRIEFWDASVEEVKPEESELVLPDQNFVYGDHNETSEREDYGMAKGSTRREPPGPYGGRKNMTVRGGRGKVSFSKNQEAAANESYQSIAESKFNNPTDAPLSTFSIDVDTASYANVRRFLTQNNLPPRDSVRVEELINYFVYNDGAPRDGKPFAVHLESAACPWNLQNRLVRIGIKAKEIAANERKASNLVFLVDVSGSMSSANKLSLAKEGLRLLVHQLGENDNVAIVTYAGSCGVALPSTNASNRKQILNVIEQLQSGGSTDGASGIQLAYEQAVSHFIKDGVNRVILMTDGDFNVGITDSAQLNQLITEKAKSGVFLSVLGFGMGNLKDAMMEQLADKGNGNYAYIDSLREARKVLVDQMNGTLVTVAKDVKLQIEFNPARVAEYRLIGYENRLLAAEDFNNDKKDAGEIGAGHTVTALYEIVPVGAARSSYAGVDPLKYQKTEIQKKPLVENDSPEWLTVKVRYKNPAADASELLEFPFVDSGKNYSSASDDYKFAAAVASFGMLLRNSQHKGTANWKQVAEWAEESKGNDPFGYRREFIDLVLKAKLLAGADDSEK